MTPKKILVIAPHPDDETLGVGGSLLKHKSQGDTIYWIILTHATNHENYSASFLKNREEQIQKVSHLFGFERVIQMSFDTTRLDQYPQSQLIKELSEVLESIQPQVIYMPHSGDIHSDHKVAAEITLAATKSFRLPSVEKILAYETLSETEFGLTKNDRFEPHIYVNIESFIDQKLKILSLYEEEIKDFPFPRSLEAVKALAAYRGVSSGFQAAEAFMLLKEIIK